MAAGFGDLDGVLRLEGGLGLSGLQGCRVCCVGLCFDCQDFRV